MTSDASFHSAVYDDYSITYFVALQWVIELMHAKEHMSAFSMLCVEARGLFDVF